MLQDICYTVKMMAALKFNRNRMDGLLSDSAKAGKEWLSKIKL